VPWPWLDDKDQLAAHRHPVAHLTRPRKAYPFLLALCWAFRSSLPPCVLDAKHGGTRRGGTAFLPQLNAYKSAVMRELRPPAA